MSEQEVFDALKYRIEVDKWGARCYYNTNGQLHRENGPAIDWTRGRKAWYINGEELSKAEFNQRVKLL